MVDDPARAERDAGAGECDSDPATAPEAAFDVAPELFGASADTRRLPDDTAL